MSIQFGQLKKLSLREVWSKEAAHFTPWLAENLDVLADELGMSLTLVATEVPVGQFKLDSTKNEVLSDSCHASSPTGENVLGEQAKAFFGG